MPVLPLILASVLLSVSASAEPLRVFASVVPIQTFVQKIGGAHVDARVMVRPGFSPHTYDPTPQQIVALSGAALYVRTGVPFEDAWMARIRSSNPDMAVLDVREGITLRAQEAHDHDDHDAGHGDEDHGHDRHDHGHDAHQHDHGDADPEQDRHAQAMDPHVWTSPRLARHMVGLIRDRLSALDPANAAAYARNHDEFVAELDELDRELQALLEPLSHRRFLVFHPAWGYFADRYGLVQVPIEREGKEPGARALAALIDQAKDAGIRVVFVQPQFDRRQARQVARAIGGGVIAVDPLAADYVANLRRVGQQFAQALQR